MGLESAHVLSLLPPLILDLPALRGIGWPWADAAIAPAWQALLDQHPQARPARVIEQHRSGYVVLERADGDSYAPESLPQWQQPRCPPAQRAAVGDWVLVEGEGAAARIVALLPRRGAIKRASAGEHYGQQIIAANIDTVFVVCGLDGDFNPRRIERYLLLIGGSGAVPVIVLTKTDLHAAQIDAATAQLAALQTHGVPIVCVDATDPASVAALHPWLGEGCTAVLVGSSGAGKSTLTNSLLGIAKMKTGAVRRSDDRGRHTTTYRALLALPDGGCLIDTPGMRELKPTGEEDVAEAVFDDIEALAATCRFRDCQHANEPGCAVQAALQAGTLAPGRLANYLKLRQEVQAAADKLAQRQAGKTGAKVQTRALHKRLDDKYGRH